MDTHTGTMDTTMARGLLMPSLRPLLMLTMAMDTMAMDTMAMPMPMDTMHTHMPTTMATSMARGLPMLTMAIDMDTMAMDMPTMDTMATLMPTVDTMDIIINLSSLFVKI